MQTQTPLLKDLVLVGGGHSHALVLRMLAMRPIAGLRITLVSPASHTPYSGMLPGLIAGHYRFEETHIDLARLCQWAGVRFLTAEVTGLNVEEQSLSLAGRPSIEFDLVSLDIGSQPELDSVPGARDFAVPVKPVASLWQRWQSLLQRLERPSDSPRRIALVGGGAGSVELALAMAHKLAAGRAEISLWCGAPEILQGYNSRARAAVSRALQAAGVLVALDSRVAGVEAGRLIMANGSFVPFDELFWCTGAAAAPWVAQSGLPVDAQGFLEVNDSLQSTANDMVFGAGDIATQVNHPRPKAGVYAVRQAPVLAHNLRSALLGKPLRSHRPQQRFLSLVSLGGKRAAADKGPLSAQGHWVWRWKDSIDRKFMARFEDLPSSMPLRHWGSLEAKASKHRQAPCGGCGAKIGADLLARTLADLAADYPEHSLAPGESDDVALIPGSGGAAILQSIDVLRSLLADPWLMGRIAANHALSDLYASGARPVSALALVVLAFAGEPLLQRELRQLLAGALYEFEQADCRLNGGHSMQGVELSLGFAVNGVAMAADGRQLETRTARPGDKLVLTKPLGTGVLFAGQMQLCADGRDIDAAVEEMLVSNRAAAELALTHKASACTDVTGFGLVGHLADMLGDGLSAVLELQQLPLLDGALALLQQGVRSSMDEANRSAAPSLDLGTSEAGGVAEVLFDPQTSGGLLVAIAAARAQSLLEDLRAAGYTRAAIIGELAVRDSALPVVSVH